MISSVAADMATTPLRTALGRTKDAFMALEGAPKATCVIGKIWWSATWARDVLVGSARGEVEAELRKRHLRRRFLELPAPFLAAGLRFLQLLLKPLDLGLFRLQLACSRNSLTRLQPLHLLKPMRELL